VFREESLAERFIFESRIGRFTVHAVLGALYMDESGGHSDTDRIGIASSVATTENWLRFESMWRQVLKDAGREDSFHAVNTDVVQQGLNLKLADVMCECRVWTLCITVHQSVYKDVTTATERARFGNAFGFARYVNVHHMADQFRQEDKGDVGYYIEQGGKGCEWLMIRLNRIYRSVELRRFFRMGALGPVDRRIHLPVHAPDLASHEVITCRHTSVPLMTLGAQVTIRDITGDEIRNVVDEFSKMEAKLKRIRRDNENHRRRQL
jgi:hypothetical protein